MAKTKNRSITKTIVGLGRLFVPKRFAAFATILLAIAIGGVAVATYAERVRGNSVDVYEGDIYVRNYREGRSIFRGGRDYEFCALFSDGSGSGNRRNWVFRFMSFRPGSTGEPTWVVFDNKATRKSGNQPIASPVCQTVKMPEDGRVRVSIRNQEGYLFLQRIRARAK